MATTLGTRRVQHPAASSLECDETRCGTPGPVLKMFSQPILLGHQRIFGATKMRVAIPTTMTSNSRSAAEHGFVPPSGGPDLSDWEQRPRTQIVTEKTAAACPYLAGSERQPRNIRTLRRWRKSQPARGPSFLKIGGRYFYTIGALRDFYQRCVRGEL